MTAYQRVTFRGVTVSKRTRAFILTAEEKLPKPLVLTQGSYNPGGVGASGGTHDAGGAFDASVSGLTQPQITEVVHRLRDVGGASWHRTLIPNLWPEHIHTGVLGDRQASPALKDQFRQYRLGLDGLADAGVDPDKYRPNPIPVFSYRKYLIRQAIRKLRGQITKLKNKLRGK